jgi:hypothetical protein
MSEEILDPEKDFVKQGMFNTCGCVEDSIIDDWIAILKMTARTPAPHVETIVEETGFTYNYCMTILHLLDSLCYIEHGSALRVSWITDEGLKKLKELE